MNELLKKLSDSADKLKQELDDAVEQMPNKDYDKVEDFIKHIYAGLNEIKSFADITKEVLEK